MAMDLQYQSAHEFAKALAERKMGAVVAGGALGYLVSIQEHPDASVHFGYDNFRGLDLQITFDGKRVGVPADYLPTPAGAALLADYVVAKIAGGRRS